MLQIKFKFTAPESRSLITATTLSQYKEARSEALDNVRSVRAMVETAIMYRKYEYGEPGVDARLPMFAGARPSGYFEEKEKVVVYIEGRCYHTQIRGIWEDKREGVDEEPENMIVVYLKNYHDPCFWENDPNILLVREWNALRRNPSYLKFWVAAQKPAAGVERFCAAVLDHKS